MTPPLQNVAKRLFAPKGSFKLLKNDTDGIRRTFLAEGMFICNVIGEGREVASRKLRDSYVASGMEPPF